MNIVVVDDQEEIRYSVAKILGEEGHTIIEFNGMEESIVDKILEQNPSIILLDVQLGKISGIEILTKLKHNNPSLAVILMTAYTTPTNIIEATKLGVRDILQKPFEANYFIEIINRYKGHESSDNMELLIDTTGETFIGSYKTMGEIYKKVGMVASNILSVMIRGETGTGKELIAKLIHAHSSRKNKPFITINCAAIPNELFEGEFFGYERGSFTGADKRHIGYLESGDGGIVFLDEVGEMPLFMQSKLLRFLETKKIKRLGSSEEISLDVKIVSATNIDISKAIEKEQFREDLYYRLSSLYLELPPLRDRVEDIPLLVSHFIKLANKDLHTNVQNITTEAMKLLSSNSWHGNIRELKNVITNSVLQAVGDTITLKELKLSKPSNKGDSCSIEEFINNSLLQIGVENAYHLLEKFEKKTIQQTLDLCEGNISKASEYLHITRNTLRTKLKS